MLKIDKNKLKEARERFESSHKLLIEGNQKAISTAEFYRKKAEKILGRKINF